MGNPCVCLAVFPVAFSIAFPVAFPVAFPAAFLTALAFATSFAFCCLPICPFGPPAYLPFPLPFCVFGTPAEVEGVAGCPASVSRWGYLTPSPAPSAQVNLFRRFRYTCGSGRSGWMPCKCLSLGVPHSIACPFCAGEPLSAFSVHLRKWKEWLDALQVSLAGGTSLHRLPLLRR